VEREGEGILFFVERSFVPLGGGPRSDFRNRESKGRLRGRQKSAKEGALG